VWRPQTTDWTEILTDREDAPRVLEALAGAAAIELQHATVHEIPFALLDDAGGRAALTRVNRLRSRCSDVLPAPRSPRETPRNVVVAEIADRLEAWEAAAQAPVRELRQLNTDLEELSVLSRCLELLPLDQLRLDRFHVPGDAQWRYQPWIATGPAPMEAIRAAVADQGLVAGYEDARRDADLVVAGFIEQPALADFERRMHGLGMRFARIPDGIPRRNLDAQRAIREREAAFAARRAQLHTRISELDREYGVAESLWLCDRQAWLNGALDQGWPGERFVIVSGWIPRDRVEDARALIAATGVPFLLRVSPAVEHGPAPVVLRNPSWARRFEVFVRAFGTPAADEVDPSPLLAWVMPLMFGYMFGDVGHGVLILLAGLFGQKRWPVLGLFVPAGVASIVFGLLYGSVMSVEHLLPALWLVPLEDPLTVLVVPLAFGVFLMCLGLVFAALHAVWGGRFGQWAEESAPVLVVYLAALVAFADPRVGGWIAAGGVAWAMLASFVRARRAGRPVGAALGGQAAHLVEESMQLAMNTLSFVRIGAFALAHGGLSLAVVALAGMSDGAIGKIVVFVLGNLVVTALEGMIVSIQATRLVLFEFFRRFLQAGGRPFRPLTMPDSSPTQPSSRPRGEHQ